MLIGVISDTHGTLSAWAAKALKGADLIVHAGDVGSTTVLDELACIARVVAVRGNMDSAPDVSDLPDHVRLELDGARMLVVHQPEHVRSLLSAGPADVVVVGHTHHARIVEGGNHLTVNPGSASRPIDESASVALLHIDNGSSHAEIVRE